MRLRTPLALALVAGVALAACGSDDSSTAPESPSGGSEVVAGEAFPDDRCAANEAAGTITYLTGFDFAATASIVDVIQFVIVPPLVRIGADWHAGKLTIWVNHAGGIPDGTPRYLTRTPEDNFDGQIALNLKGVWLGATTAVRAMQDGGAIINISSRSAYGPQVKNGPYGAAKAAVNSLTTTLAVEVAPKIRVNAVAPGPIPTENFDDCMGTDTDEKRAKLLEMIGIPMGRYGMPEDIAAAVVYLASPASSWVTGQCLYVTGGR
jgi:NAD(P)-dependent dehydrogenase (short-subunit alcohol dehydrogenase family)